jgi:hypothetical protein
MHLTGVTDEKKKRHSSPFIAFPDSCSPTIHLSGFANPAIVLV